MIPATLHIFHDGDNPLPEIAQKTINDVYIGHLYSYKIWKAKDLPEFPQKQWLIDNKQWSCLSDVCRHYAVYTEGGFYMDTDCELVGDLDRLRRYDWFTTHEPPHFVNCAFSGGVAGNRVSEAILKEILQFDFKNYKGKIPLPAFVGPWLQTKVCKEILVNPMPIVDYKEAILPLEVGFGLNYTEYHRGNRDWPESAIVRHHWAKSW